MQKAKGNFSEGSVSKNILRISLPIIIAEMIHVTYNLVDRMFISHMDGVGTAALTGVGIAFPLVTVINAFARLCGTGGAPLSSMARGEGNTEKARRIQETAFTMLVAIGILLTALLYIIAPWALEMLGGDQETLPYAVEYFRIYVLGSVPVLISLGMTPLINSQGFAKVGMFTVIIGAALNIALDPLMIYTLNMGVQGAAWATVISQCASALWATLFLFSKRPLLRIQRLRVDVQSMKDIMKLGVTGFCFQFTNSIIQTLVNITLKVFGGALSTLYVGAMSIINSIREVAMLSGNGITNGATPVISYNYGARHYDRVSRSIRFTLAAILMINLVIWSVVMFFPAAVLGIITPDQEMIRVGIPCIRIYFGAFPFMALQVTGQNTFVALNKPKFALFFSMFRKLFLVAALVLILPRVGMGVFGVFWAEFISQVIGATFCFVTMCLRVWRPIRSGSPID